MPLSALVSLKHFIFTHIVSDIHPAGLVLFLIICGSALIARRGFCSWVCPVGLISDYLAGTGTKIFKRPLSMPPWLDFPLRALKYIVAVFFIYQILFVMSQDAVDMFLNSSDNRFADIKMLHFFTGLSHTGIGILLLLGILSMVFNRFWCRYLCPYGALLGVIGYLSPGRIHRDSTRCTGCGRCDRNCPSLILVSCRTTVNSLECSACLRCVENCPEKGVLRFSFFSGKPSLSPVMMGVVFVLLFGTGIMAARMSGHWQTRIPAHQYLVYAARNQAVGETPQGRISQKQVSHGHSEKMKKMIMMMQKKQAGSNASCGSQNTHG